MEAAFKNETIGLATREEFLNKKNTLKDRQIEDAKRKREQELQLAGKFLPLRICPVPMPCLTLRGLTRCILGLAKDLSSTVFDSGEG